MGAGKVFLHLVLAGALLGVTYAFFWAVAWLDSTLGEFVLKTYADRVWLLSGILAGMIVFSAIAKDHDRLELLSSASFLIYAFVAYSVGSTIYTAFIPYIEFGVIDVEFVANLSALVPGMGAVSAQVVVANTVAAWLIIGAQALKFFTTFFKSIKRFKAEE